MYVYFTAPLVNIQSENTTLAFEAENENEERILETVRQAIKDAGGLSIRSDLPGLTSSCHDPRW